MAVSILYYFFLLAAPGNFFLHLNAPKEQELLGKAGWNQSSWSAITRQEGGSVREEFDFGGDSFGFLLFSLDPSRFRSFRC